LKNGKVRVRHVKEEYIMVKIYTDTNVLRYFGVAFAKTSLAEDLQVQLLLSPLTLMELISQLGTDGAEEAFAAIQALPGVHNAGATGMLPWSDDLFRMALFSLPPREDTITPALNNAVINILDATKAEGLSDDGKEMRALLDEAKSEAAKNFSAVLNSWRSEGPLSEAEDRAIFARSIARQAGFDEAKVDVDLVVKSLDAHYVFENHRMQVGAQNSAYNVDKHSNDVYDAELLIYLADPTLHLLTCDRGFRRVEKSSQANRVHIADPDCLKNPECATNTIRGIVEAADTAVHQQV
jgi:hypothetical protein